MVIVVKKVKKIRGFLASLYAQAPLFSDEKFKKHVILPNHYRRFYGLDVLDN